MIIFNYSCFSGSCEYGIYLGYRNNCSFLKNESVPWIYVICSLKFTNLWTSESIKNNSDTWILQWLTSRDWQGLQIFLMCYCLQMLNSTTISVKRTHFNNNNVLLLVQKMKISIFSQMPSVIYLCKFTCSTLHDVECMHWQHSLTYILWCTVL